MVLPLFLQLPSRQPFEVGWVEKKQQALEGGAENRPIQLVLGLFLAPLTSPSLIVFFQGLWSSHDVTQLQ